ncbi:hypothetical protein IWW37_002924 [Coemansia sp. RSA 2050]|nr:hypothetical protein IWW37_002924 [Coemansia sp. RSA 2050]KAJ2731843.1 hypothetical protein IW152_004234 [Coemansia sp. BCRC 34962]
MAGIATLADLVFGNTLLMDTIAKHLRQPALVQLCQVHKLGRQTVTPLLLRSPQLRTHKQVQAFSRYVGIPIPYVTSMIQCYGDLVQALDLSEIWIQSLAMTYDILSLIFMYCRRVKVLSLKRCHKISGNDFRYLFLAGRELCWSLISLNVTGMHSIIPHLKVVFRQLPNIKTLILNRTNINDAVIIIISQHMPSLELLEIVKCSQVTDVGIQALASGCPKLAYLQTRRCKRIHNVSLLQQISARGGKEVDYDDSGSYEEYYGYYNHENDYDSGDYGNYSDGGCSDLWWLQL